MNNERLVVIWTSGDKEVALKMVFMYTIHSKKMGWWNDSELIVWGPSAKLLSEDLELQEKIIQMKELGIKVTSCKACTDSYGVTKVLEDLGIEVQYMGEPLTQYLKDGQKVITF